MITGIDNMLKCAQNTLPGNGVESALAQLSALRTLSTWWCKHTCIMKCARATSWIVGGAHLH